MAVERLSRRQFLELTGLAGGGLMIGVLTGRCAPPKAKRAPATYPLNAFLQIGTDDRVTIWIPKSEMGQGVRTSLAMILADELDADWSRVAVRQADLDPKYGDQGTGGSGSVWAGWKSMREAGATAKAMLAGAAAVEWQVDRRECHVDRGVVLHPASGRRATFGELAELASRRPVPKTPKLKKPSDFTIIGRGITRVDCGDIVTGRATYGIDVTVPGMLYAAIARSPVFGGKVARVDETRARTLAGFVRSVRVDAVGPHAPWNGVAALAGDSWTAMEAARALDITWDEGNAANESSEGLREAATKLLRTRGESMVSRGDPQGAVAVADAIEADYEVPFLAHAAMEPMNCVAHLREDRCEIWAPTQFPGTVATWVERATGVPRPNITVHVTLLGGAFGRRINPDFAVEAALISKAIGAPVKVVWSREEDMRHDFYRPASFHRIRASLDERKQLRGWLHRIASPSIRTWYRGSKAERPGESEMGGAAKLPYVVPNFAVEYHYAASSVPRGWWRSVDFSGNTFVVESFIDELAAAAGRDPLQMRLDLLGPSRIIPSASPDFADFPFRSERLARVLRLAAEKGSWGKPRRGIGRGIAAQESFFSYAAQVAEVELDAAGRVRVRRIVCAVDCGTVVDPDGARAQVEGGILFGLSAALHGEITIERGRVVQSSFHDYPLVRFDEAPEIEVHFVQGAEAPTGLGEPSVPPTAPAVTNAIFALTGVRIRRLPIRAEDLRVG